ncbi:SAM-dependent methyltransferase [Solemya velum gill symbiont]|uniref:SAM-dependent methyltransferase n=2 Tax=Solemya velum gill symbiont TaxID=2340 RepID=UPI0009CCFADC|nr:SAM-dependent methyltransferase [Solemya velum gill symbiont]OOY70767.1 hypothetical protein BOW07_02710 [Solemya velum gill symbiont]
MDTSAKPPVISIMLVSASALAFEVLLIRLFSIIQWHHFAYMIISLALLGYGVSGTIMTLLRERVMPHYVTAYIVNGIGFALTIIASFLLVQKLPFNALEILWDSAQWGYLLAAYLLLLLPFFFVANCIVLTFGAFSEQIPRIYGFDLFGAGVGSLVLIYSLMFLQPQQVLLLISFTVLIAVVVAMLEMRTDYRLTAVVIVVISIATLLMLPKGWLSLQMSPNKPLSQYMQVSGSHVERVLSGPHGVVTVLENRQIPFRLASGISLNNSAEPPTQYALFVDSDGPSALTRYDGDRSKLIYLDYQTSALPYHLSNPARVLILGMGGGSDILQAEYHDVGNIEAVEMNPHLVELLQDDYADFAGWAFLQDHTRIHLSETRAFLAHNQSTYDLIQMSLLDAAGASSAGLYALSENYLYTTEALGLYYRRLQPGGMLSITRWIKVPPRDALKLFATAVTALREEGVSHPENQLAMIRGWNTSTLLIKHGVFTAEDIRSLQQFCDERSFDVAWYPGITDSEVNLFNAIDKPYFYEGARALLGKSAAAFIDDYKFSISPATDDRPYYFNFFKWESLAEILSLQRRAGFSLIELGYLVLVFTLIQALLVSVLLVLLPLRFVPRENNAPDRPYIAAVMLYFVLIGLALLFVEIAFIQRFILFLGDPVYAVAAVLCGFLVFSGLGSFTAPFVRRCCRINPVVLAVTGITIVILASLWLHPLVFQALAIQTTVIKLIASVALIAPLAFFMGMPFPIALNSVSERAGWLLPWAWSVNGFASLMSAIVATLIAVHFGFTSVMLLAVLFYSLAALVFALNLTKQVHSDSVNASS